MPTPSGAIGIYDARTEFIGGSAQAGLFDFYAADTGVPASGQISLYDLRDKSAIATSIFTVTQGSDIQTYYDGILKINYTYDMRGYNSSLNGLREAAGAVGSISPQNVGGIPIRGALLMKDSDSAGAGGVSYRFYLYLDGVNLPRETITRVNPQGLGWLNEGDAFFGSGGSTGKKVTYWSWTLGGPASWDGQGNLSLTIEH